MLFGQRRQCRYQTTSAPLDIKRAIAPRAK
jgi:hypothetical protein